MFVVNKEKLQKNEGKRYDIPGTGAWVVLRPATAKVSDEISRRHRKPGTKGKVLGLVDEKAVAHDRYDYVIVDWGGFVDENGQPIPCTREEKIFLMENSQPFSTFVGGALSEMGDIESNEDAEKLEKNSASSPGGSGTSPGE